jgi:DNA-directed RNA polymerase subunit M/transcription elongation factor TFIIS
MTALEACNTLTEILPNTISLPIEVYTNKEYNNTRRLKILLFGQALNIKTDFPHLSFLQKQVYLINLEKSCFDKAKLKAIEKYIIYDWNNPLFTFIYNNICYNLSINADPESYLKSTFLKERLESGEYKSNSAALLTSRQMNPVTYTKYDSIFNKKIESKVTVNSTGLYRCGKCKQNKCRVERRYNCSIDEGTNLTIYCVNCGHQWNG